MAIEIIESIPDYSSYRDCEALLEECRLWAGYENAMVLLKNENYEEAERKFAELGEFQDSEDMIKEVRYQKTINLYENDEFADAATIFFELGDYRDSDVYAAMALVPSMNEMKEKVYQKACDYYNGKKYAAALAEFEKLEDYSDSQKMASKCNDYLQRESHAKSISAGIRYALAVREDGTVVSSGYNKESQSNVTDWTDIISVSGIGVLSVGLKEDGTVVVSGEVDGFDVDVSDWTDVVDISAGERYVVALKNDGTVLGQGHDAGDGQLQVDAWRDIIDIATGWRHTVGLDSAGNVHITGYRSSLQLHEIEKNKEQWTNRVSVAAGGGDKRGKGHTLGLRADGTVVAVGDNEYGQCDVDKWTDIVAIAAGDWHSVGLKSDGTVVAVGYDEYSQVANANSWSDIRISGTNE